MHTTQHINQRMSQRGITRDLVDFVVAHGETEGDRFIINRKVAMRLLESLQEQQRLIKKILDKGGVVVVTNEDALVTTYNIDARKH